MAIITLAEWKTLTGTTGTAQDTQVTALIPYVQADFVEMCNNDFGQNTADEAWPDGCKLYVAKMITYQLNNMGSDGDEKKSESIGDYSYTRSDRFGGGYPAALMQTIALKYGRVSLKSGTVQTQFRDKRGMSIKGLSR